MCQEKKRILAINTGSTSTKIALYEDETEVLKQSLVVDAAMVGAKAVAQLPYREESVRSFLASAKIALSGLDIIVARGGMTPACEGGAYSVNQLMIDVLTYAPRNEHESSLSAMIGFALAAEVGSPVIIYDAPPTDEFDEVCKHTGLPGVLFPTMGHPLNTRRAARRLAQEIGKPYEACRFIVAHLGGSITVDAHRDGRIVDTVNAHDGPMSVQRAGRIPSNELISLCYSGIYTQEQMRKHINGLGGYMAYCGTQDGIEVERRAENGDAQAQLAQEILCLQTAKGIAEMAATLSFQVDRIILTGGQAHSKAITESIIGRVGSIATVVKMPGEFEMEALALGGFHVLEGTETAKEYTLIPPQYDSQADFYQYVQRKREE